MERDVDVRGALGIRELRARFLTHTRAAWKLLPARDRPRILDIGCGEGVSTMELASLSAGNIVGIDTDEAALVELRRRIERADLSGRVEVVRASLYETGLPDGSFDILWGEGVLHLLEASRGLSECGRLLRPGGFLVLHETIDWFDGVRDRLPSFGLRHAAQHLLPKGCWWTDYGAPLEERIRAFREARGEAGRVPDLARYEQEVAMLKEAPERFDCGFFIIEKW